MSLLEVADSRAGADSSPFGRGPAGSLRRAVGGILAGTGLLVLATYLYFGYRYDVWPQPGFLQFVVRYSGDLTNDWYTNLGPAHWAIDHALGALPHDVLPAAVAVLWVVSVALLWASLATLAVQLGAGIWMGVASGLLLIPTGMGGFGVSETLYGYFYPNTLSFALACGALALLVARRFVWSGAALGLAILAHPGLGPLFLVVVLPWVALEARRRPKRFLEFVVPVTILGGPAIVQLLLVQSSKGVLTSREVYEFLGIIRQPHHMTYSFFPASEWTRTALWAAVFATSAWCLRRVPAIRPLLVVVVGIVFLCTLGAWSSSEGRPLIVFMAQTARLSAFIPPLAAVCAGAAMFRINRVLVTPVLILIFLLSPRITSDLMGWFPSVSDAPTVSAVEAGLLLVSLGLLIIVGGARPLEAIRRATPKVGVALAVGSLAAGFLSLLVLRGDRWPGRSAEESAGLDIERHARHLAPPGAIVVAPPTLDGFRSTALRPDVVEFGSIRLGEGDAEWRHRILALTQDARVLDPDAFGTNVAARQAFMDSAYQHTIATTRKPICAYGGQLVVTKAGLKRPAWLASAYRNEFYEIFRVRSGTCPA